MITGLVLKRDDSVPLHRQLYDGMRKAILERELAPGARLPSTRVLAAEMASPGARCWKRSSG